MKTMSQIKVKTIEQYKDSQGEHIVGKGKLLLIEQKNSLGPITGYYGNNKLRLTELDRPMVNCGDYYIKPIIISEIEEIEVGDKLLYDNEIYTLEDKSTLTPEVTLNLRRNSDSETNFILGRTNFIEVYRADCNKILALPEQFSHKHLQAIIDSKLKDGDECLIKCGYSNGFNGVYIDEEDEGYFIKLNSNNHI